MYACFTKIQSFKDIKSKWRVTTENKEGNKDVLLHSPFRGTSVLFLDNGGVIAGAGLQIFQDVTPIFSVSSARSFM
jgi:hypothetical protein